MIPCELEVGTRVRHIVRDEIGVVQRWISHMFTSEYSIAVYKEKDAKVAVNVTYWYMKSCEVVDE